MRKLQELQDLQNFARPTTKIDAEMQMSRWKAINETVKIKKNCENYKNYKILQGQQRKLTRNKNESNETAKITKLRELQNFSRPATKIEAEMQMSRWKAINETAKITKIAKITRITKFCKASSENRRRMEMS